MASKRKPSQFVLRQPCAYAVVEASGEPILFNAQLPIFWKRRVAFDYADQYGGSVIKVLIVEAKS